MSYLDLLGLLHEALAGASAAELLDDLNPGGSTGNGSNAA